MEQLEQQTQLKNCLESLSTFSKEQLLEELEQLLLTKTDKGESLKSLEDYYSKGGLRRTNFKF